MLRLFESEIELTFVGGSRIAIMHGCIKMRAAQ